MLEKIRVVMVLGLRLEYIWKEWDIREGKEQSEEIQIHKWPAPDSSCEKKNRALWGALVQLLPELELQSASHELSFPRHSFLPVGVVLWWWNIVPLLKSPVTRQVTRKHGFALPSFDLICNPRSVWTPSPALPRLGASQHVCLCDSECLL